MIRKSCLHYIKFVLVLCFCPEFGLSQNALWVENLALFNPSGVEINSFNYRFKIIDWNHDTYPDIIIHEKNKLNYYEHTGGNSLSWQQKNINLPAIKTWDSNEFFPVVSSNFDVADVDRDGDWDIVSDSLYFHKNVGTNESPDWVTHDKHLYDRIQPAVISGDSVKMFFNLRFLDFNGDDKPDIVANYFSTNSPSRSRPTPQLFLYSDSLDSWNHIDSVFNSVNFENYSTVFHNIADFENDGDFDLLQMVDQASGNDASTGYYFLVHINRGDNSTPNWDNNYETTWPVSLDGLYIFFERHGRFYDMNGDGREDYIFSAPNRNLEILENQSTVANEPSFAGNKKFVGRLNVEAEATPFLFTQEGQATQQLIVSENFENIYSHQFGFFYTSGRLRTFGSMDSLSHDWDELSTWLVPEYPYGNKLDYFINFSINPLTAQTGVAVSHLRKDYGQTVGEYRVEFFNMSPDSTQTTWIADSAYLAFFDNSDLKFSLPCLVNLDQDIDLEVVIKRDSSFTAYQMTGTVAAPDWQEAPELLSGVENLQRHHLTFVDFDDDSDPDLVFGNRDGTLDYYENPGNDTQPRWQKSDSVFDGLDVGENAAPVFGDIDNDTDLDLIIGNKAGFLYYYENQTIVHVEVKPGNNLPQLHSLSQNYPNPFNPATKITFALARDALTSLTIYNIKGQLVDTVISRKMNAGGHEVEWNAAGFPSGLYIYRLRIEGMSYSKKLLLIK